MHARYWHGLTAILGLALLLGMAPGTRVSAQDSNTDSSTPAAASGTPAVSDTVWFVIAPEGKSNGDYFDIELNPGESTSVKATIGNGSAIPVKALIYAADANSGVNGGFVLNDSEAPVSAPTTWLDFPTAAYDFEAGEGLETSFTVSVPADTAPGQYITGIAIETADAEQMPGTAPFMVKYRLAAAVLITVPGPVSAEFSIGEITVTTDGATTTISGGIENAGNIRVQPKGTLRLTDADGVVVVDAPIEMGSVYAGDTTSFEVYLPTPLAEGAYTLDVDLSDADTGASAARADVEVDVAKLEAPTPVTIASAGFTPMPSADNVVFVQVAITISNTGVPVGGADVILRVFRDGEMVDEATLATAMTIANGDTVIEQPYLPASGEWEPGEYTFEVAISATDPTTGTVSSIATMTSDTTIVIP
jgi:methionine-rich copper-binding protein CopC